MITLYHVPGSRSVRSYWLLNELGVEFEVHRFPFTMKALRTPEYLAISPAGRVPAIVDGDTTVFESGAIAQYLCNKFDPDGLGRRTDHAEWAQWVQWIHYAETISVHASFLVQQANFIAPEDRSDVVHNLETRRLRKTLEVIDRRLEGREYLLAGGFSAADIAIGYSIYMGLLYADETGGLDNLIAYYDRVTARDAFAEAVRDRAARVAER